MMDGAECGMLLRDHKIGHHAHRPGGIREYGGIEMQTYKNISERWGDAVGGLTVEDFRAQAVIFDADPDKITADTEHVYYAGEIIADAE